MSEEHVSTPPDYRVGNFLLLISQLCDLCRRAGIDSPAFLALAELSHEAYRGIAVRGARCGALIDAVRAVRGEQRNLIEMPLMDFKVSSVAAWVAARGDSMRSLGVDFEIFERVRLLAKAIEEAITDRGALVIDVLDALRGVRADGSILEDLPSIQAKLRERDE